MLNFNQRVQQFLKQHRENKKHAVIAVMLALMVAFSVCGSLIMPAVSMTGSTEETAPALEMAESEMQMVGDSAGVYTTAPEGSVDFGKDITQLTVSPEQMETVEGDTSIKKGKFTISYKFDDSSSVGILNGKKQPYIHYTLPSTIIIPKTYSGEDVVDNTGGFKQWLKNHNKETTPVAGHYTLDPESHLIVIEFTDDYCQYVSESKGFEGTVKFEGNVKRSNTKDGDTTVEINGQKIHVEFDDQPPVISKNASVSGGNAPEITWTVTLTNPGTTTNGEFESYTNLNGYTLEDVQMPSGVTVNPAGVGTAADGKFTFSEAANKCEKITFTYHRALTEEELRSGKLVNTATLKDTSFANVNQATAEVSFATSKAIIAKSGTPSYAIDGSKGYIEWTLTVQRSYGKSLKDYVVADDALAGATIIKATDRNGNDITSQIAVNGGKATIGAETDYVTITYRTAQTTNGTVSNHATVTPPDGNTPDGETDSSVKYDTSELFSVDKGGKSYDDISATWIVTLDSTGTNGTENKGTLNGYVLSDEAFARMIGDFTIVSAKKDGQNGSTQANVTFTKNADGTYTVNGDANYLQFTYRARLSDQESQDRLKNWTNVKNTITVTPPDGDEKKDTAELGMNKLTNSVTKTLKSGSTKTDTGYYDKTNPKDQKETLSWEVTMDQYTKFSGGNKAYVDVMSATGDGEHYIIPKDAKIHVMAATGEKDSSGNYTYQVLTAGTDYTIQFYSDENHTQAVSSNSDKAKSYVVTFLDAVDNAGYTHMKITYETIADVTKVGQQDTDEGNKSTFSNKASFNGQDSSGNSYTFERKTPKTNLTAKKEWVQDDPDSRPKSITVQLFRRAGTSGDWVNIGEQALTSSNGYQYTWPDLLQCTNDENQTPYYYKIEEVVTDDLRSRYDVTYAYDPSGDGLKVQGQTNATLTVTNTWKNIKVSVNKQWIGDTAAARPDTIQVKLQQRIDGTTEWIDVSGQNALTMNKQGDSFTSASWTNLPKTDANGKTIYYRAVEVNPSENYTAEFDETGISATGGSIIKNTWNYLDLTAQKKWVGDEGHEDKRPASIKVKLQQKTANGTWEDVAEKNPQTLTKQTDGSFSTAIWSKLPKKDSNGSELSYRAVEVTVPTGYSETDDENGIRQSGTVTITNTYDFITISGKKEWAGDAEGNRPDSITFQLQRKTGANGTWADVEGKKQELKKTGGFPEVSWTELPRMDENKNLYFYRVIESPVPDGYTASAWDETGSNQSKTFTITNTLKPPYSKSAIKTVKITNSGDGVKIEPEKIKIDTISPEDLSNWETAMIDVDGTSTECYLFQWMLTTDLLESTSSNAYDFYDILPQNSLLVNIRDANGKDSGYKFIMHARNKWVPNSYYAQSSQISGTPTSYNGNTNCVLITNTPRDEKGNLNQPTDTEFLIYCTAIPKSIVDDAIAANGSYQITNQIIKKDDTEAKSATLTIQETKQSDAATFSKSYISAKSDRADAVGKYQLIVNPEGKTLSNDATLDVTDVLQITGYQPAGGTRTDGSDLADAILKDVTIYETDADGNIVRTLPTSEYSYLVNTADDVQVTEKNYDSVSIISYRSPWSDKLYSHYQFQVRWNNGTVMPYEKGVEVVLEVEGQAGKDVNAAISDQNIGSKIEISGDTKYDENGKAQIKLTFLEEVNTSSVFSLVTENTSNDTSNQNAEFKILSSKLTTTTVTTKTTLNLTVPDEMPLKVWYEYQMRINEKTLELEKANLKDDEVLDKEIKVGANLPVGSAVFLKNAASLHTSSGDIHDNQKETNLVVEESSGSVQTTRYPTIQKVDIGDYSIGGLTATFKLAKYDTSAKQWVYATGFTEVKDSSSTSYEINYTDSATETVRDGKTYLPAAAADLNVDEKFNVRNLNSGTLYKLVETKAPKGYEKTGWVSAEATSLETLKAHTYYFVYDGSVPGGLENELKDITVSQITANGTVQIANNNLIDIGAEKSWSPVPENAESVELELWWSFSKSMDNAKKATADDLGMSSLNASAMLSASDGWKKEKIWTSLPNGKDGRPIYYFVKEVSYTIGGSTTVINADGTWNGSYAPVYVGNGLNKSGVVSISNTEGLMLRKVWKNSDGSEMQNPPLTEIGFKLYGIKDGTSTEIYTGTLKSADGWQMKVPDSVLTTTYDSFRIEEVLTDEQRVPLYGYVFSDTYNVVGNSGEITLINKDSTPTEVNVSVEKVWGDGINRTPVTAVLLDATREFKLDEISALDLENLPADITKSSVSNAEVSLSEANSWKHAWKGLPRKVDGVVHYYYVLEQDVPEGCMVSYSSNGSTVSPVYTITNSVPTSLRIQKKWQTDSGDAVTTNLPDEVSMEIYRNAVTTAATDDSGNDNTPDDLQVVALGDSITLGEYNGITAENRYPQTLQRLLQNGGFKNASVSNNGTNSMEISAMSPDKMTADTNVLCLLGGTNDVLHVVNRSKSEEDLRNLITKLHAKNQDAVILVGGIPCFNFVKEDGTIQSTTITWYNDWSFKEKYGINKNPIAVDDAKNFTNAVNNIVTGYDNEGTHVEGFNEMIARVVQDMAANDTSLKIQFVDVNANFDINTMLEDGVHPNAKGYESIANTYYSVIQKYYQGTSTGGGSTGAPEDVPQNIAGLPSNFYLEDGTVNTNAYEFVKTVKVSKAKGWNLYVNDLPETDKNGTSYVYYVRETSENGWTASYTSNGQIIDSETPITVTNTKTIEKTSISVEKKWVDNDKAGASHGAVNVTLRRKLKSGTDYDKGFSETAELSSSNGWTHTWSSLDKTDAGGNQYLYDVVEESVPSGYQATYKNNGVNGNTAENPIVIVNTKVLQLTLKKRWSDSDTNNHQNDPVEVRIYRSTNPAVVPVVTTATTKATTTTTTKATTTKATTTETTTKATTTTTTTTSAKETKPEETTTTTQPKLKLTAADNKTELLEKGGKLQLTADPSDGVTFKSSSDEIATVDSSGLVTGQKVGTVTITAHKDGYEDATIQLTVKDATKRVDVSNAAAGKKIKIKLTGGVANQTANGCYGYSYQDSGTWKWQQIYWEQTLDANGSAEWEYTVPNDFGNGFQIRVWWVGGMIPPVDESIKIEYTVEEVTTTTTTKPEETTTTTTTTPPPSSGDTVTGSSIVLEKDAHSVNLDSTKTVSKLELNISLTSTTHQWYNAFYFEFKKANQTIGGSVGFTWDFSNSSISEVNWNNGGGTCTINGASLTYVFTTPISTDKLEIVNGSKDNSIWMIDSYTITYATDTSAQSLAAPSAMRMLRMAANVMTSGSAGVELVDTVTLKGSDSSSWQAVRTNLPACDGNGNPYYYWAEETAVGGYTPSYTYAGGADNYISGADGVITITNTKEESASVTMPATGGRGTRWYTITGAAILCGTAAGYLWFRRRYLSRVE